MGSLKMSELSITSVGAPKFESTQRTSSEISTPNTPSVTSLFDLQKVPSNVSDHMIGQVNDHIGLIEKAQKLKKVTTEKLNNIGNKYEEINKQITIEIRRLKAETEADDLKIATLDREKERIDIENSAFENDQTNDEIANAKNIISDLTKSLRMTAEELRNINDEREKLIAENSILKKERFEEEIALKDRNDVISMALKELEDLERQLRLFNNAKSLHLLSL